MTRYITKVLMVLLGSFLISCSSTTIEEFVVDENPEVLTTYEKDVKSIVDNSCATTACHGNLTNPAGGFLLTTYDQVISAVQNRGLTARINNSGNPMPPSGLLDQATRSIIDQWVVDGLLEN